MHFTVEPRRANCDESLWLLLLLIACPSCVSPSDPVLCPKTGLASHASLFTACICAFARRRDRSSFLPTCHRQRVEALEGEVGQLRRALEGCMAAEALHRQQAADAAGRATKARSEVAAAVQEVHSLLAANAALEDGNAQLAEQLAAAHTAADELRRDHTAVRKQLLQARTTSTAALLATAAAEAQDYVTTARSSSLSGGSSSGSTLKSGLPPGIVRYVQVLQFGLKEAEGRAAALQRASEEGAQAESELRLQAAAAYDKQLACQRALLHQVRRAHSLEGLRLADVRELHSMERQLAAQSQELAQLRERLVASRLLGGSSGAAAGAVAPLPAAGAAQMPRSSASGSGRVHSSDVRLVS